MGGFRTRRGKNVISSEVTPFVYQKRFVALGINRFAFASASALPVFFTATVCSNKDVAVSVPALLKIKIAKMTSDDKTGYDVEYQYSGSGEKHRSVFAPDESGAVHGETFVTGDTFYHRLQRFAGRYGVEQRGIERVPEDERTDKSTLKVGTMVSTTQLLLVVVVWKKTLL